MRWKTRFTLSLEFSPKNLLNKKQFFVYLKKITKSLIHDLLASRSENDGESRTVFIMTSPRLWRKLKTFSWNGKSKKHEIRKPGTRIHFPCHEFSIFFLPQFIFPRSCVLSKNKPSIRRVEVFTVHVLAKDFWQLKNFSIKAKRNFMKKLELIDWVDVSKWLPVSLHPQKQLKSSKSSSLNNKISGVSLFSGWLERRRRKRHSSISSSTRIE